VIVPLRLDAPAKLNLSLRVVGRRDDGFHLLETEMVLLDLADRLLLMPGCSGLRVEGEVEGVPPDETNLAWRGLRAGLDAEPVLACLALEKRVPPAAGLGGGSSDAAAAWRLGRAWRGVDSGPTADELADLGRIGADVPFFAAGTAAARVSGIGEAIEARPASRRHVILVHPPFRLSTADVFAELRRGEWGNLENDLLAPARRLAPALDDLFALVIAAGGTPRLTGSGPTLFSLEDDAERAAATADALFARGVRATISATRTTPTAIERVDEEEPNEHP
jgi:4-diphosphocytidyl-2-C-methyl-D-erythritol kinase